MAVEVEFREDVVAQRVERDSAEFGNRRVIEHHIGQIICRTSRNVVEANTASPGHEAIASREGHGRRSFQREV